MAENTLYFGDNLKILRDNIGVAMIRDFAHVIDREKAALGLFITLAEPTRAMKEESAAWVSMKASAPRCSQNFRYSR